MDFEPELTRPARAYVTPLYYDWSAVQWPEVEEVEQDTYHAAEPELWGPSTIRRTSISIPRVQMPPRLPSPEQIPAPAAPPLPDESVFTARLACVFACGIGSGVGLALLSPSLAAGCIGITAVGMFWAAARLQH